MSVSTALTLALEFICHHLDNLRLHTSPSILSNLNIISIDLLHDSICDDGPNATVSQALSKWLHIPRSDGKPKQLSCREDVNRSKIKRIITSFNEWWPHFPISPCHHFRQLQNSEWISRWIIERWYVVSLLLVGCGTILWFFWDNTSQLGLEIALISRRFDRRVDEHFKTRKWILDKELRIREKKRWFGRKQMEIVDANGEKPLPIPQIPLPNKVIGVRGILITYFDHNVITFRRRFHRFFPPSTTNLAIVTENVRIPEFFVSTVWPMFGYSTQVMWLTTSGFHQMRQFAPSILNDCQSLRFVSFEGDIVPEFPPDDSANATDGQAVAKWLFTPHQHNEMNVLSYHELPVAQWSSKLEQIKTAFSAASSCVCFSILFGFPPSPSLDSVVPFELTNALTEEQLTLSQYYDYGQFFLLIRCPIGQKEKALEQSKKAGTSRGSRIFIGIGAEGYQGDIILPITPITSNVVDAVFNQFCKVEQSKAKYVNLYGAPFVVTVTVLNTDGLPRRRTTKGNAPPIHSSQSHIFKINNNDNYCLFYALELMRYYSLYKRGIITRDKWRWINNNQTTVLQQKVQLLLRDAGIPTTEPEYDAEIFIHPVQGLWSTKYPGEYKIFIFNDYQTRPITKSDVTDYQFPILLYHHDKHFDGIKTISKFFNKRYYCLSCESFYERKSSHSMNCSSLCHGCREVGVDYPCEAQQGYFKKCLHCKNNFYNNNCYERHLHKDLCSKFQRCEDCGFHIKEEDGENPCQSCFIQPLKQQRIKPYRIIAYDFEATQDKKVGNRFEHEVNFAAATIICTECINNGEWKNSLRGKKCQICGPHRTITFSPFDYTETTVDQKIITQNPLRDFVGWLLFEHTKKYSTVAFAHFGGRYDMTMIIKEVLAQGIHNPDIIKQGNRLYELKIKDNEHCPLTILHDSYNLMPIKLSGLIKSFGLKIQDKQHFPHMFNKSSNYDKVLPHLPPREDYCPNQMKKADLQSFNNWYNNNLHQPFDLKEKLPEYCCNDVKILTHALVELRREFKQLTQRNGKHGGIDILWQAMTIASACVKNYALNHLKPNSLAIVPEKGYTPQQNQSALAIKYLDWYSHINNVNIQTAHSRYGEYVFKREGQVYQVDGYIKGINGRRDKIIEVNGCLWHGCEECFEEMDEETRMPNGKTLGQLREREVRKHDILSRYVDLEVIWEHEINEQLKKDTAMREYFDNWKDRSPIRIRDAFHGGRTGPMKLLHTAKPRQKISYKDFTSLYPWTNFSTDYPLGHPKIISFPVNEQTVNWRAPSDNPYKGLLKVLLLPPNNNIKVTVMPIKFDERLLFPLCQKCAKHITAKYPNGLKDNEYSCPHFNPNDPLEAGYTARKLFHVLQYDQWSNNVFKSYVSEMMALKIHATGFPSWCESEEQKKEYIEECWMKFAIKLDKEKMKSEPGKRYIAKLCLNSLWGRFSMRNLLSKAVIDNDESLIHQYTEDKKIELIDLEMMDEDNDVFMLTYKPKEEFVDENKYSNVVISLFTTSMARLYLYEALKKVADTPGCEILYFDTDSIIYVHPEDNDPLPTGKGHLGELTDKKPDHNILEFISAGCKNYGLKLQRKDNGHPSEMKVEELFIIVMRSLVSECWIGDRRKTLQSVVGQVIEQEAEIKSSVKPLKENDLEKSERKPTHTAYNLLDHQRFFWKLARPKFAVINFLCPGCRRINYKHKDQFKLMGEDEFHFTQARPHRYGIKDDNEEPFDTRFYAEDLAKTRKDAETTYRIERMLKTRTRSGQKEHLVKFYGYKEPEWIKDTDIER
ncbi:hypothetical protein niasHT_009953 [Heterodera trifolii]|uniref:DNA-directed DNA polymerase n=1 Tax=Heterodera trifolii TaxID=157864 RepID=A0ABD2LPG0_9BILA